MRLVRTIRILLLALVLLPALAHASFRLEVTGLRGNLLENVRLFVGEPASSDPLVVRRHAEQAEGRAREALEALGHYDADIRVSARRDRDTLVIHLEIDPGEPIRLGTVQIDLEGAAAEDPAFAEWLARLPLREGDILHHGRYEDAKRALETLALSRGYFDAEFLQHEIRIHRSDRRADIFLRYESGPRYRLGPVRFPATPLHERLLIRLVPFQTNQPYSAEEVAALHRDFINSDYFEEVRFRPRPEEADEHLAVPIDADLKAAPRNRVGIGVGATTDVGPRLRLEWAWPRVNARGHSARIHNELSLVRQDVSAQYTVPLRPPLDHQLHFTTGRQREDIEDTETETLRAEVRRRRLWKNGWQHNLFIRWEREHYTQADVRDTTTLTIPGFSIGRTRRRGLPLVTRGDRIYGLFEAAHPDLFSDIAIARMLLQSKITRSLGPHRLSGRIEYGALDTEDFDRTPPSLRFFAGGDQSVRGFGYQTLGPRNDDDDLTGGRFLATGSLEYTYQFTAKWGAALFYDIGNASADRRFAEGFAEGTGFGLRWLSPLAPLRLDFAWGVSESDPPFRVHFSMGTDL